jgi:hypothetical protein
MGPMKTADLLQWFEQLRDTKPKGWLSDQSFSEAAVGWQTGAASALAATFPPGNRVMIEWERAVSPKNPKPVLNFTHAVEWECARWHAISGVFASAHEQLREGRIEGLVDAIRAEAEDDVLEQAAELLKENLFAGAAVLAGGALETHLRWLCEKNTLTLPAGHGSIEKYNTAIAQARNNGLTIYEKPDQSMVTAWGQLRNEAAHDPAQFNSARSRVDVQPMIDGIRLFITRYR